MRKDSMLGEYICSVLSKLTGGSALSCTLLLFQRPWSLCLYISSHHSCRGLYTWKQKHHDASCWCAWWEHGVKHCCHVTIVPHLPFPIPYHFSTVLHKNNTSLERGALHVSDTTTAPEQVQPTCSYTRTTVIRNHCPPQVPT